MATYIESAVKDIDERLRRLREEASRLEAARSALLTDGRRGPSRLRSSTASAPRGRSARRPGRPRGRRGGGTRGQQALELVRANPGITIPQLAKQMRIAPNYLYRVMPQLVSDGSAKREGNGWHAAGE